MRRGTGLIGLVALITLVIPGSVAGQQIGPTFQSWEPVAAEFARGFRPAMQDTLPLPRRDYRYEGLAFGGIVFGAAGAWLGWNLGTTCPTVPGAQCEPDRLGNAVATGLVGAAIGGGLGYLVGRLSSKPYANQVQATAPADSMQLIPDSARRVVGYQHWKGAAIGAAGGALIGALLGSGVLSRCSDCDTTDGDVVKASLITAGLGGAFGFLVGLASPKYESP